MSEKPAVFDSEDEVPTGAARLAIYEQGVEELFYIEHPTLRKTSPEVEALLDEYRQKNTVKKIFVYYPWLNLCIEMPDESSYFRLRTARNRNLITDTEQQAFRTSSVGIAGLSIGSAALASLVQTGGSKKIKLADPDSIDITNLNRIKATLPMVGMNKTSVAARSVWELDPFADLELYPQGVSKVLLPEFLKGLTVCVDEMDDIALKIEIRNACKEASIPVVMATDNGDSTILDVERFDTDPNLQIFHGRIQIESHELQEMDRAKFIRLANRIIDPAVFTQRQQASLMEIGKTLSGVAQLSTAASIAGASIAFAVRQIATGSDLPSGRYVISLEEAVLPGYMSESKLAERAAFTQKFRDTFGCTGSN